MSYGGIKQSGLGKEASLEAMLEHFTQQEDHHRESRPETQRCDATLRRASSYAAASLAARGGRRFGGAVRLHSSLPQTDGTLALPGLDDERARHPRRARHSHHRRRERARRRFRARLPPRPGPAVLDGHDAALRRRAARPNGSARAPCRSTGPCARSASTAPPSGNMPALSPEMRAVLDAYAAGVNAFLATRHGALPPEYYLLDAQPGAVAAGGFAGLGQDHGFAAHRQLPRRAAARAAAAAPHAGELAMLYPPYREGRAGGAREMRRC